jgi:hypothetical protein
MPILFTLIVLIPLFVLIREYIKDSKEENVDTSRSAIIKSFGEFNEEVLPIQWTYESSRFISSYMERREITFIDLSLSLNDLSFTSDFGKKDIKIDGIDMLQIKNYKYILINQESIVSIYVIFH